MKKCKIAQIGTGHDHADGKMECVRRRNDLFEVVGVAEPDERYFVANHNKEYYQGIKWMSVEELLSIPDLDAVLVETEELKLVETGMQCVKAGKAIHVDKPAGEDIDAFTEMMSLAKQKKLPVQMAYMYRYNPSVMKCFEMADRGELGEIFEVDAIMDTEHSASKREWLGQFRGGIMFYLGCHMVDLVFRFMGIPENIIPYNLSTGFDGVQAIDHSFAVFEYRNGISTVRSTSTEINGFGRRQLVVCGSRGSVEIKPLETNRHDLWSEMFVSRADMTRGKEYYDIKEKMPIIPITGRYDDMMADFYKMVMEGKENSFSYEYEVMLQKLILKACGFDLDYKKQVIL